MKTIKEVIAEQDKCASSKKKKKKYMDQVITDLSKIAIGDAYKKKKKKNWDV